MLGIVASLAFVQQGCQMSGCRSCGTGSGISSRVSAAGASIRQFGQRVLHHKKASADCCEPVLGSEVPIEYGTEVLTPAPGAVMPAPALEGPGPVLEPAEPIPSAEPLPNGSSSSMKPSVTPGASKSSYETRRPAYQGGRSRSKNNNVARALLPERVSRPAGTITADPLPAEAGPANPLDDPPPLELPRELVHSETRPIDKPASEPVTPPAPASQPDAAPAPATADTPPAPAPAPAAEATPTAETTPAATAVAPGSWRFANVEPNLAGGSVPDSAHLDWLSEKGYKTLVDLRAPQSVQAEFLAEVSRRGFRYVLLPVSLDSLNAAQIQRFQTELSQPEARPIYFFDERGSNAALLWYVRRRTLDRVDDSVARREAEEMGEVDLPRWEIARVYLDSLRPPAPPAQSPAPVSPEPTELAPPPPAPVTSKSTEPQIPIAIQLEPPTRSESVSWKPLVAMAATVLALPLAYLGRTGLSLGRTTRASLPGTGQPPRALPPASDA